MLIESQNTKSFLFRKELGKILATNNPRPVQLETTINFFVNEAFKQCSNVTRIVRIVDHKEIQIIGIAMVDVIPAKRCTTG